MHVLPEPYEKLAKALAAFIPVGRLIRDPLHRLAYGTDASFYRLVPEIVVKVESEQELSRLLVLARTHATPVTFRGAGTSVSGQALSDSVLVMLGDNWRGLQVSPDHRRIRLQPGVLGGQANRALAPFHRKIGPDPASVNICTIGGIAANNSRGMCCRTSEDSYHTLVSMRLMLADGTLIDTADAASRRAFAQSHRELLGALDAVAARTRANPALAGRIREKFKIRNTSGYSLNALLDFEDPIDVLQHLMIGSEGTLGFIAEITYRTVEDPPHRASTLALFPDVATACRAASLLEQQPVAAVELMDRASLRSVEGKRDRPAYLHALPSEAAALLIDTRAPDAGRLRAQIDSILGEISPLPALRPVVFTNRPEDYTQLWRIRQGLFPSVGAMRAPGTSVITEDVVFRLPELAPATLDLQHLLRRHGYNEAIILGHALEGNLHIIFTEDFGRQAAIDRYTRFMEDYTRLVVERYDGSLKGEHGTGRNIAPFVEREWGAEAYALMGELKALLDPDGILNPGVMLNADPQAHVRHLKSLTAVDPLVDKCIECGACEPMCPSSALTLSPRQRIVVLREIVRLEATPAGRARARQLRSRYRYEGIATCAGDGLCALACPVGIDTGEMMRRLHTNGGGRGAAWIGRHFAGTTRAVRLALALADAGHVVLGARAMHAIGAAAHKLSAGRLPSWNRYLPTPAGLATTDTIRGSNAATRLVYFPSCLARTLGPARGDPERQPLPAAMGALVERAGYALAYPSGLAGLCCGLAFASRGASAVAEGKRQELEKALLAASSEGTDLVVCDTSPCSAHLQTHVREARLKVLDVVEFVHDLLLPRLRVQRRRQSVAVHATCSTRRMGLEEKLLSIARSCAQEVVAPEQVGCCGWAGAKGFFVPELPASALRHLRTSLPGECTNGYSSSRTCEIGLSCHSGRHYRSIVYLVADCAR